MEAEQQVGVVSLTAESEEHELEELLIEVPYPVDPALIPSLNAQIREARASSPNIVLSSNNS